jgi:hypothetical protein
MVGPWGLEPQTSTVPEGAKLGPTAQFTGKELQVASWHRFRKPESHEPAMRARLLRAPRIFRSDWEPAANRQPLAEVQAPTRPEA